MTQPFFAYIDCPGDRGDPEIQGCGTRGITQEQYEQQLSNPWATWRCPCCGGEAYYNDELSEAAQGISANLLEDDWPAAISI